MENMPTLDNQRVEEQPVIQKSKKKRWPSFSDIAKLLIRFISKHRIFFSILTIAIVINFLLFCFIPIIDAGKTKFVNINTPVKVSLNQTIKLKFSSVSISIKNFTNSECPDGQKCYGGGAQSVEYEMSIDGKKYATGSVIKALGTDYQIETESSDYESFAIVKIIHTPVKN